MQNIASFKEYLQFVEAGLFQPNLDPNVANANKAIVNNTRSMLTAPCNDGRNAADVINKAAEKAVVTGQTTPGAAVKALNPPNPNQVRQQMMKKGMKKK